MISKNIACAIMAGGENRRYNGKDKSFVEISGRPLIEMILKVVEDIFDEIIIVTNNPESYRIYNHRCKIISDKIKNIGPLGGFYTAMINTSKNAIFYLPCDMPFINKEIINSQIKFFVENNCEVLQPKVGNLLEPMHSIYKTNLSKKLKKFLEKNKNRITKKHQKKGLVQDRVAFSGQSHFFKPRQNLKNINNLLITTCL